MQVKWNGEAPFCLFYDQYWTPISIKFESSSIPFPSDLRSDTVQDLSVRWKVLLNSHIAFPSHCRTLRFPLHCTHLSHALSLLSLPEASHWLLNSLLKIRLLEISTFCGWGAGEKYGKFQLCSESTAGSGESSSLSLCLSIFQREREGVCEWLLILRTRCAAAISLRSDIPGFSWNCLYPHPPCFACLLAKLIPSPHPIRFRAHTSKTFVFPS